MRIIYLFDPLCGWCYGAGPALEKLAQLDGVTVDLAPTGLFAGGASRPMDKHFAAYAWQNDQRIARLTGQPFMGWCPRPGPRRAASAALLEVAAGGGYRVSATAPGL